VLRFKNRAGGGVQGDCCEALGSPFADAVLDETPSS
jgi:hypothetical protein